MRIAITGVLAVLLCAGTAHAVSLSVSTAPCPVAGMTRYVVSASTGTAEVVATVCDLTITGDVHQVWDFDGSPSPQIDSLGPDRPSDWVDADTCLLIVDEFFGTHGAWTETNPGTMGGSGLSLYLGAQSPMTGMGTFGHTGATAEAIQPPHQASTADFLQVVIPTGTQVTMDVSIGYGTPGQVGIEDIFTGIAVPEPAALGLLAAGGLAVLHRRRG